MLFAGVVRRHSPPCVHGLTGFVVEYFACELKAVVLPVPHERVFFEFVKPPGGGCGLDVKILGDLPDKNRAAVALCHDPPADAAPEGCVVKAPVRLYARLCNCLLHVLLNFPPALCSAGGVANSVISAALVRAAILRLRFC